MNKPIPNVDSNRIWLNSQEAAQAGHELIKQFRNQPFRFTTGFPSIDALIPPAGPGHSTGIIGAKGNGKTPILAYLARRYDAAFRELERDRPLMTAVWKGEEDIESSLIAAWRDPHVTINRAANGMLEDGPYLDAAAKHAGDNIIYLGRTAAKAGLYRAGIGKPGAFTDVREVERAIKMMDEEGYSIGAFIGDYMQCFNDSKCTSSKRLDQIQAVAQWAAHSGEWLNCPAIWGLQANQNDIMGRPPHQRIPQQSDTYYTQDFELKADAVHAIMQPRKAGLKHVIIPEQVFWYTDYATDKRKKLYIPIRRIPVTSDLFIYRILSHRHCEAAGLTIPISGGGGDTGRPFGDFQEIPYGPGQEFAPPEKKKTFKEEEMS